MTGGDKFLPVLSLTEGDPQRPSTTFLRNPVRSSAVRFETYLYYTYFSYVSNSRFVREV